MSRNGRKIFWGLFLVIASGLLIASQFVEFVTLGFWSLLFTVFLVALIIKSIPYIAFPGIFFPLAFLYKIYQVPLGFPHISLWILLLAAALVSAGLGSIFWKKPNFKHREYQRVSTSHSGNVNSAQNVTADNSHVFIKASFAGETRYVHSSNLKSAEIVTHFGGMEVYFDDVVLSENGAEIYLDAKFGGIELNIPANWNVNVDVSNFFGGVDFAGNNVPDLNMPKVIIRGKTNFGGVEIYYR